MPRKIIQLVQVPDSHNDWGYGLFAVADDGTAWYKIHGGWFQIDSLPQPEEQLDAQSNEGQHGQQSKQPPDSLFTFREALHKLLEELQQEAETSTQYTNATTQDYWKTS